MKQLIDEGIEGQDRESYSDDQDRENYTVDETLEEVVTASQWATISNGKIVQLSDGYPPHELKENQISLTDEEYALARAIRGDFGKAIKAIKAIQAKILANGS